MATEPLIVLQEFDMELVDQPSKFRGRVLLVGIGPNRRKLNGVFMHGGAVVRSHSSYILYYYPNWTGAWHNIGFYHASQRKIGIAIYGPVPHSMA